MIRTSNHKQQSAFSHWLRTGRLPAVHNAGGIELKFNPWHDPDDGRFTFAGSGRHHGAGGGQVADRANPRQPRNSVKPRLAAAGAEQTARPTPKPAVRGAAGTRFRPVGAQQGKRGNPAVEFASGVGEGLYDVAEGVVTGTYAALTTNPATTARNAVLGIADTIDAAIAAEETPARIQLARARNAVANASPRDIGRAAGSVAGNVAVSVAPGAAVAKVSAARRLRGARPSPGPFPPPQIGWVKERITSDKEWKLYNDSAVGARPGLAPTLMRTLPNGKKRPVKFDGFQGEYMIDRKWSVVDRPHARAQLLRQSEVLAQHRLIGVWEVPTPAQKALAHKLFKKMNVTNIVVKVVKP